MDDLISRQAAIDALDCINGVEEVLRALPSAQPPKTCEYWDSESGFCALHRPSSQPEPCEYCNEDVNGYVTPIEKNGHAFVRFGMNGWELIMKANGWHGSAKIRYCPMCGRKLLMK